MESVHGFDYDYDVMSTVGDGNEQRRLTVVRIKREMQADSNKMNKTLNTIL